MGMAAIFLKILNMSFTGACAILLILLVRLMFHRLPKKYVCILWAVVLIRLLCPFTFPTAVAGLPDIPEPIPANIMEVENPYIHSEIEVVDHAVNSVLEQNFTPSEGDSANPLQIVTPIAAVVWCAGIVAMLIYTAWKLHCFHKWVKEAVPDKSLGECIYRCAVETPVVTGVLKPRIYLPFDLKELQLKHVLTHEQMHIKRKDHLLKMLFYTAVIVHWFNPFVWLAYRLLERDMEMACDEAVLGRLGTEEKTHYCESLLDLASSKNHFVGNPVAFGESDVKVRIKNLLKYEKPYFWVSLVAVIVIIAVAVACLSSPMDEENESTSAVAMVSVEYPLTKESVDAAFSQVDLPGVISEEEYDSEVRTSLDIRDEENRLIAGIASNGDGEKRFLGITLVPYLHSGAASVCLPAEKWEDIVSFATLLYGFKDKSIVYNDFIENYEGESIHTEYQYGKEPYYKHRYEWIKSYGNAICIIEVCVATDGTREIQTISFYNSPEYSALNSEMATKNFMFNLFTSIPGRYETYLESGYNFSYLNKFAGKATEKCLQYMEDKGYYTLIDEYADQAGVKIRFVNAVLTDADEVNGDKDVASYRYIASLTKEKDGEINELTVEGEICVVNMLNGWKVDSFQMNDTEALVNAIMNRNTYELANEQIQPQSTESHQDVTEEEMIEIFKTE